MATIVPTLTTFPGRPPGDGLCLFFFDARKEFYPAGIGSSLGYCNYNGPVAYNTELSATKNGLQGAFLGIGFDVKGDFSTTNQGKVGSKILDTSTSVVSSCVKPALSPNTICIRTGELSSYNVYSVSPNLSTFGTADTPALTADERYGNTPSLTLHEQVASRDDITFKSVRVTIQDNGKRVKVEIKSPADDIYYPYQEIDLQTGLGDRLIPYTNPETVRVGLAFSTSESVMNCEIKNFSIQGEATDYEKLNTYQQPPGSSQFSVYLSAGCL